MTGAGERLTEALGAVLGCNVEGCPDCGRYTAALLPVVERIAAEKAAEELERVAAGIGEGATIRGLPVAVVQALTIAVTVTQERVAQLRSPSC